MAAPTELEIRAAIAEGFDSADPFTFYEAGVVYEAVDHIVLNSCHARGGGRWSDGSPAPDWDPGSLWANMPPDQAAELRNLVESTIDYVAMLTQRKLMVALASALTNFAEKYPDLERGTWKPRELVPA